STLNILAAIRLARSDFQGALEFASRARQLYESSGGADPSGEAENLKTLGSIFSQLNDQAKAQAQFERAVEILRAMGDQRAEARVLLQQAEARFRLGDGEGSFRLYSESLRLSRNIGDRGAEAGALSSIAAHLESLNDTKGSEAYY